MDRDAIEVGVAAVASKSTYAGAGTSFLGWLFSSEFTVIFGIVVALVGLGVNWYYKAKADRRQRDWHEARMASLRRGELPDTDQGDLS
jgi:hypothetical protein